MNKLANQFADSKPILNAPAPEGRRAEAERRFHALNRYISERVLSEPCDIAGHQWAGPFSLKSLSENLGVSLASLRRDLEREPIIKVVRGHGAEKAIYLRIGSPDLPSATAAHRKMANTMSKIWREFYGYQRTPPRHYGPLLGLARELPDGWQVKIFDHTVRNWEEFVNETWGFIDRERLLWERGLRNREEPYVVEGEGPECAYDFIARDLHGSRLRFRKVEFINPAYLLRFHKIASQVFVHHMDQQGKPFPEEVWWA